MTNSLSHSLKIQQFETNSHGDPITRFLITLLSEVTESWLQKRLYKKYL